MVLPIAALLLVSCGSLRKRGSFAGLVEEFVYTSLSFTPVAASASGYHYHQGVPTDELIDDMSKPWLERRRAFYEGFRKRLAGEAQIEKLTGQERADYEIIQDQIALALLELDVIQEHRHNPTLYVELIGNALFNPFVLEYAPLETRFRHIVVRLEQVPWVLKAAKENLEAAPEVWTRVAIDENAGNMALIDKTLRQAAPASRKKAYEEAAARALEALRDFDQFLRTDLSKRTYDWRLGKEKYAKKFRHALSMERSPEELLRDAESQLEAVRKQMYDIALPLHQKLYPSARRRPDPDRVIRETLDKIADRHATPATHFADARRDLEEARKLVREKNLMKLPARDNLQVIETPEFMRGIYAMGGFSSAPALEPQLGAFYWLTPIPANWPKERIESKLREYNFYGLKLLTIHEAIPGHYLQFEYANDVQPKERRLLRTVFGNGPYAEGWAVYATELMLDEGYLDHSPELRLTFLKQQLRMIANAILDIRLQTMGMKEQEALDLMILKTFQEKEEATAKIQRAQLSSTQLPTYFAGWREWKELRRRTQEAQGPVFSNARFHEAALATGAVPMRVMGGLLSEASRE